MKKIRTFPLGGIHPPERKSATEDMAIQNAYLPAQVTIPLSQHIGVPSKCLVEVGESVKEEQIIGQEQGFVSARIHSSIPGKIEEIKEIFLPNGMKSQAVVITMEGEFKRLGKKQVKLKWRDLTPCEILKKIEDKGVVGMGGATFPSHVKLAVPEGRKVEHFIVNAAECEPYLTSDHSLMREKARDIVEGLEIIQKLMQPDKIWIGIEINKKDAIWTMEKAISQAGLVAVVVPLKTKYPQGAEKNLIKAIIGKEVPSGKLPLEIGAVNANVGTIFAVYEAVVHDKPVVERIVTVSGGAIKTPRNLKVKIGTPFSKLIEECGGFTEKPAKVISGGPMMGFTVYDLETPVTKGTSGILALTKSEVKAAPATACLQCGNCIKACPMGLQPTLLFKMLDHYKIDGALAKGLLDCVECGSCSFMCPAHIPLVQGFRSGKKIARSKMAKEKAKK